MFIPLNPNADISAIVNVINENFRDLENRERTTIYKDEKGKRRIIIGRLPDGTYGLVISKEGVDVLDVFK